MHLIREFRNLSMPWVEVWLGVLLSGFELEQRGEFYQAAIWVKCLKDLDKRAKFPFN